MKPVVLIISLILAGPLVSIDNVIAQMHGPRRLYPPRTTTHPYAHPNPGTYGREYYYPSHFYRDYTEIYPKFYGGFHSRHYTTYGVPPGDIGLRGNGIHWMPW